MSTRWPDKYIVGLTGNIATGKSAVMEMAASQGALAIDADQIVHYLLENDLEVQDTIEAAFGSAVRNPDKSINRGRVGAIVFGSEGKLSILESIIHPAVRRTLLNIITESEEHIVFIEAIKLLESSLAKECDQIWVTRCPREVQIERLVTYRGMDEETAALRVSSQAHQDEKIAAADVVIDTAGSMDETAEFFKMAWERMLRIVPGPVAIWQQKHAAAGNSTRVDASAYLGKHDTESKSSADVLARPDLGTKPAIDTTLTQKATFLLNGVTVHRATPSDVPDILWLIRRTSGSAVRTKRRELLMSLGERGYLIGRKDGEISALAGWSSENLVGTIDLIIINPPEAACHTGAAILQEIEDTANALICEVILAFPPTDPPAEIHRLFTERGYIDVQPGSLPRAWLAAVEESQPPDTLILMKILRDTRAVGPV
ncbi:MAG: dephospho-CoA kinase [Candidatus Promineifilaceae bacterium]